MMLLLFGWEMARAGCGVDTDGAQRQANAGLAVVGTVVRLDVVPGDHERHFTLRHHVRVQSSYKGAVQSGFIALDTLVTAASCPGGRVYAVGERVYAVGSPSDGASLPVSSCTNDTGKWSEAADVWLARLPKRAGRTYAGTAPILAPQPMSAFPEQDAATLAIRVTTGAPVGPSLGTLQNRAPSGPIEGRVVSAHAGHVQALFDLDEMTLALWVGETGLAAVPVRSVWLAGDSTSGVRLRPGAPITVGAITSGTTSVTYEDSGMRATGTLAAQDVGIMWKPVPAEAPLPLFLVAPSLLWGSDGTVLAALSPSEGLTLAARGEADGERLPVNVHTPSASATGFIQQGAAAEGVLGGLRGGVISGGPHLTLRPGVQLVSVNAEAPVTFGEVTQTVLAALLYEGEGRAIVGIDSPWGRWLAWVACRQPYGAWECMPPLR